MYIIPSIKNYILQHGQVEIPHLGKLSLIFQPAKEHPVLHTFTVPGKYLFFQEMDTKNEDFLHFLAKEQNTDIETCKNELQKWVENLKHEITQNRIYQLDTMGNFALDSMHKLIFTPKLDLTLSPESFGLEELTVQPYSIVHKNEVEKETANLPQNTDNEEVKKKKTWLIWLWVLLGLLCLTVIVIGIYYQIFRINNTPKSDVNQTEIIDEQFDNQSITDTSSAIDNIVPKEQSSQKEENAVEISQLTHYVVIGSFKNATNADNFLKSKHSTYPNAVNLGKSKKGLYMIAIGPYTLQDAENEAKNIANSWILDTK
ncbi:MAG: SPOR domain-containing protein [Bacteroidales bacterium]|jgi:nucleoid DNA-binding protein|nr:SPOR domain-containing protein [Bacteroidales bacterium]